MLANDYPSIYSVSHNGVLGVRSIRDKELEVNHVAGRSPSGIFSSIKALPQDPRPIARWKRIRA